MDTTTLTADDMYQILIDRNDQYEGRFFIGVKTTGIFCRPTCTARKPKRENVEFFDSVKLAIDHGYRPCKVCRPLESPAEIPAWVRGVLDRLEHEPDVRLRDADLLDMGIDPARLRRWFKRRYNMTFHAYQRSLRINQAFGHIRQGMSVTDSAYGNGYESISGFQASFKKMTGFAPIESRRQSIIAITQIRTPLGPMMAGATEAGICLLEFTDRRMLGSQLKRIERLLGAACKPGISPHFKALSQQLAAYFDGSLHTFDIPMVTPGTDFQKRVWSALQRIPYGNSRSYIQQADHIGQRSAVRAVARANGDNRLAILIPCHRVIGHDGGLRGYGGGLWRKKWLLDHEQKNA